MVINRHPAAGHCHQILIKHQDPEEAVSVTREKTALEHRHRPCFKSSRMARRSESKSDFGTDLPGVSHRFVLRKKAGNGSAKKAGVQNLHTPSRKILKKIGYFPSPSSRPRTVCVVDGSASRGSIRLSAAGCRARGERVSGGRGGLDHAVHGDEGGARRIVMMHHSLIGA